MALITGKKKSSGGLTKILALLTLVAVVAGGVVLKLQLTLPEPATVALEPSLPAVGQKTNVHVVINAPGGIQSAKIEVAGTAQKTPRTIDVTPAARDDGTPALVANADVALGKSIDADLVPGQITVTVTVQGRGTRLRTPDPVTATVSLDVKLDPPSASTASPFIHPTQGGAEVVVYDVSPSSTKDGVAVGDWFFPGYPLPGGAPTQRVAFFAVPYDLDASEDEAKGKILLVAEDALGNRSELRFIHKYFPRPMGKDTIALTESFMQKVTGEIFTRTPELQKPAGLLEGYLKLNGELRAANMAELKALAASSKPAFLWKQTFLPMQNAAVKGSFADRRTYTHEGKAVDTQDHLGFDLASLERAAVPAANDGVVVLAKYFGIFGNCVVVDHGFGLMTLYAHLSSMAVKVGDTVTRGQDLGKTGATGLAGGDHLHFTTLIGGLPVNPVEWWDGHWIKDRVKLKLVDALPWNETGKL